MAIMPPMDAPHSTSGPVCSRNSAAAMAGMLASRMCTSVTTGSQRASDSRCADHMTSLAASPGIRTSRTMAVQAGCRANEGSPSAE